MNTLLQSSLDPPLLPLALVIMITVFTPLKPVLSCLFHHHCGPFMLQAQADLFTLLTLSLDSSSTVYEMKTNKEELYSNTEFLEANANTIITIIRWSLGISYEKTSLLHH